MALPFNPRRQTENEQQTSAGPRYSVQWPTDRGAYRNNHFQLDQKPLEAFDAMTSSAVYAAVSVIAQDVARMNVNHLRELDSGAFTKLQSPIFDSFRRPNGYQSRSDFLLTLMLSILLDGNAYAWAPTDSAGRPLGLHPRAPASVQPSVDPDTGAVFYTMNVSEDDPISGLVSSRMVTVPAREMLHARIFCQRHPMLGESPLRAATYPVFHGRNIQRNQTELFAKRASPDGIISFKSGIKDGYARKLAAEWSARYAPGGPGGVAVLDQDASWHPTVMTAADAQLVEQYRLSVFDVARIYRIPAHMVGLTEDGGPQFNNAETLSRLYYNQCLGFWLEHFEAAIDHHFNLPSDERIEFDVEAALMRTDRMAHVDASAKAIQSALMTPNEARRQHHLGPLEGGDSLYLQRQMRPIDQPEEPEPAPMTEPAPEPAQEPAEDEEQSARAALERMQLASELGAARCKIAELQAQLADAEGQSA